MMNRMMQETILSGTARRAMLPGWPAAGKTGTSQDFRDAWFVGYTRHLVAGAWFGNDDNSPTRKMTGGGLPVEVWSRFMRAAHQGIVPQPLPGLSDGMPMLNAAESGASLHRVSPEMEHTRAPVISLDRWLLERMFGR
jgi:penicillin-binding protein 1A